MAEYPHLGDREILQTENGQEPATAPIPEVEAESVQFHQYLIAVGALGEVPKEEMPKALHDAGMKFAHELGLEPLLCVGYVSTGAFPPDYLAAAAVWHNHLNELDKNSLAKALPKLYVALELLFGRSRHITGAQSDADTPE